MYITNMKINFLLIVKKKACYMDIPIVKIDRYINRERDRQYL